MLLKFNENVKLYLSGYLYRFNINDITQENILGISESLLRLFTLLELVDSGYSSKYFKTFLFSENIKFVDNNIPENTIIDDFNIHISNNWNERNIEELIYEYDKNILVYLNEYLYAKGKGSNFDFLDNVNVEHIMPASGRNIDIIRQDAGITEKDEFKNIVNKLGNKILLEDKINKSIGNEWFKTKKQASIKDKTGYKNSKYPIASALTSYQKDTWMQDDINSATKKAVERIVKFIFNK